MRRRGVATRERERRQRLGRPLLRIRRRRWNTISPRPPLLPLARALPLLSTSPPSDGLLHPTCLSSTRLPPLPPSPALRWPLPLASTTTVPPTAPSLLRTTPPSMQTSDRSPSSRSSSRPSPCPSLRHLSPLSCRSISKSLVALLTCAITLQQWLVSMVVLEWLKILHLSHLLHHSHLLHLFHLLHLLHQLHQLLFFLPKEMSANVKEKVN